MADRDRFFMAMLKPRGIEKGEPFAPDEPQTRILTDAGLVGEAMAKDNDVFDPRVDQSRYADGSNWEIATTSPVDQRWEHCEALDGRAAWFYETATKRHRRAVHRSRLRPDFPWPPTDAMRERAQPKARWESGKAARKPW